ncbi:uroporphyrinogen-III synthase [Christiangramia fulva]|uniref:Uroporphyrinogen-III synthase n=1 Tax=Christiangramia fulva TaxID=2126553 RepID=A0A2R3Z3R5_9FLAO|nr:uroporphyrinogen-III synthase [Christiangramia fulva]AVR44905.1 uroporphyrinogen-III synthase [Christiangramia fulva]
MPRILSTKILAENQKQLLLNADIALVEYNAILIDFLDFQLPETNIKNAIFTSKNAVKAILKKNLKIENCFCVGEKTAALLEKNGFSICEIDDNSKSLAEKLKENHKNEQFTFFCGNRRRDELPKILKENGIPLEEIEVYKTSLAHKKFNSAFDGILFFSPSGVQSFVSENEIEGVAFCIGETTASEAKKYTKNIEIANQPGIENVIAKCVSYFRKSGQKIDSE